MSPILSTGFRGGTDLVFYGFGDKKTAMNRWILQTLALFLTAHLPALGVDTKDFPVKTSSLSQLEHWRDEIDSELEQLAHLTLRRGVGSLGYRSQIHWTPNETEWIRIELGEETVIDEVVLVPMLFRDSQTGPQAEGFPRAFRILAGTGQRTNEVAVVSANENQTSRVAPLTVSFPPTKASWIIIETNILTPRLSGRHYFLQLSEIMVFSGMENVALNKPVTVPAWAPKSNTSINSRFLVDGFTPYILDAADGDQSKALLFHVITPHPPPRFTIDLKTPQMINQINLHSAGLSYAIPMGNFTSWGVPRHVRVIGATQSDFSDATVLCEYYQETIYDNGPIIMRRFPETICRYIGVEILDHHPVVESPSSQTYIAFSEIEILSKGKNIARHAPVTVSTNLADPKDALIRITDGLNYYGTILPLRNWMEQLSRRHDLEALRPRLMAALNRRYERQKINLKYLGWLVQLLAAGIVISMLNGRIIRMRQKSKMQERFAADLHDELGADLHTIGLLSDLAGESSNNPKELALLLQQIRNTTEETGEAVRQCATMHTQVPYLNFGDTMKQIAERVVVHLEHHFLLEGAEHLNTLKPLVRSDLFLFYKEALINICRHAEATKLSTHLQATSKQIQLTIMDNGQGLPNIASHTVPKSLRRRARLMGAKVEVENVESSGTRILLTLKTGNRILLFRKKS
ncbi:MAG: histidine kinase [Pontiella sp.]